MSGTVGIDAVGPVFLMENHDRAYHLWRDAGFRDRVLVHIDAHHDMWWLDDIRSLSIANFVAQSLKDSIVRELYWIVPDATWKSPAGRSALREHLKRIQSQYPGEPTTTEWEDNRVVTAVLGRRFVICSLDSLPLQTEPVLLDIDVDYLAITEVSYGSGAEPRGKLPWCWPQTLIDGLRQKEVTTDFVTIAWSVEGAYTPLQWKFLGNEIDARLRFPNNKEALEPYELMRTAVNASAAGDAQKAESVYSAIGDRIGAAPHFDLAFLRAGRGDIESGRISHKRALDLDPSYRAAFSGPGFTSYTSGDYEAAEKAFNVALSLDPHDSSSHVGLAWIAARRKQWLEVERSARAALAFQPDLIDAHRALAKSLAKQDRVAEAIESSETALKLALAGHTPFLRVVVTDPEAGKLVDSDHARAHASLARLYERAGDINRAITGYRIAVAAGFDRSGIRYRLARLYAAQRDWTQAAAQFSEGMRMTLGLAR